MSVKLDKMVVETKTSVRYEIIAKNASRFVIFEFEDDVQTGFKTNMRYEKTIKDWEFYSSAISHILAEFKKLKRKGGK